MGAIQKIKKPHISGMILAIMAILLLMAFIAVQQLREKGQGGHHEFTNVRIVKLSPSGSPMKTDFIRQVTVHFNSNNPSIWFQSADSTASPCAHPAWGQKHELHLKHKMSYRGIPLL